MESIPSPQSSWKRLTPEEVRVIRQSEEPYSELARHYQVTRNTIVGVKTGRTYQEVKTTEEK